MFWSDLKHPAVLQRMFNYDSDTGKLTPRRRYATNQVVNRTSGYLAVSVYGRTLPAHLVAWAIYYGEWPKHIVDHINRDKQDNRISNLRYVSARHNSQNCSQRKSKLGVRGVAKRGDRYEVTITVDGKQLWVGSFKTLSEASEARLSAEKEHFIQPEDRPIPNPTPFILWELFELGPWSKSEAERNQWKFSGKDYFDFVKDPTPLGWK